MPSTWSSSWSPSRHHVFSCGASFEDIEAIDEVEHEIGGEGIGGGIANIVGRDAAADVAALLQNIVYFEANGAVFLFKHLFLQRSVPQPFLLFKSSGITGISVIRDIGFNGEIVRQIENGVGGGVVIEIFLIALPFKGVSDVVVADVSANAEVDDVRTVVQSQGLGKVGASAQIGFIIRETVGLAITAVSHGKDGELDVSERHI